MADAGGKQYEVVAGWIRQRIRDGTYPADSELPGEADLADDFGVSRWVIREALRMLADAGWITKHSGRRSIVARVAAPVTIALRPGARIIAVVPFPYQQDAAGAGPGEPVLIVQTVGEADVHYAAHSTVLVAPGGKDSPG